MGRLKVAALMSGEPGPLELWTLRHMASVASELRVVQAPPAPPPPSLKSARTLFKRNGLLGTLSRFVGAAVGSRIAARDREVLEELFDFDDLRAWWGSSGIAPVKVRTLNHAESRAALSTMSPDVIVSVSGGVPHPRILSLAKLATLNIHHGRAPSIRGQWSIPWGIVEGRRDWIGATVHVVNGSDETGPILWCGGPQLAPGDTHVDLLFRAHLEATKALSRILSAYASGAAPPPWLSPGAAEGSTYRSSAGLREWLKLLYLDQGRRARVLLERGLDC